jgi:hypothetical protein
VSDESIRKIVIAARLAAAATVAFQSLVFLRHAHGRLEIIIGAAEVLAAILFAIPATLQIGAAGLIAVFAFAGVAHQAIWLVYPMLLVLLIAAVSARRPSST